MTITHVRILDITNWECPICHADRHLLRAMHQSLRDSVYCIGCKSTMSRNQPAEVDLKHERVVRVKSWLRPDEDDEDTYSAWEQVWLGRGSKDKGSETRITEDPLFNVNYWAMRDSHFVFRKHHETVKREGPSESEGS